LWLLRRVVFTHALFYPTPVLCVAPGFAVVGFVAAGARMIEQKLASFPRRGCFSQSLKREWFD
jgi:hypothetical protein